jgi:hypothetical protein
MSRRYSPEHKLLVLRLLSAFSGDIVATSRFTGVPERTLRDWYADARRTGNVPRAAMRFALQQKQR